MARWTIASASLSAPGRSASKKYREDGNVSTHCRAGSSGNRWLTRSTADSIMRRAPQLGQKPLCLQLNDHQVLVMAATTLDSQEPGCIVRQQAEVLRLRRGVQMNVLGATIGYVLGVILGFLLIANLINVAGWTLFTPAAGLLPPPLDQLVLALLTPQLTGSVLSLVLVIAVILTLIFFAYWIASAGVTLPAAPGLVATTWVERFGRGSLIGFNAGINLAFLLAVLAAVPGGPMVAFILSSICWLACILAVSNNPVYQVVLAYCCLFLPMSAPINAVGALCLTLNTAAIAFGVALNILIDWRRANVVMHGGFIHGCVRTAFNMSNFTVAHPDMGLNNPWVSPGTPVWPVCPAGFDPPGPRRWTVQGVVFHETSHTLNVAAYGWVYHLVGFADQWMPMPWSGGAILGADSHSELCAESGLRGAGRNWLDMWAPSVAGAATGNATAVAAVAATPAAGVVIVAPVTAALIAVTCERNRGVALDSTASVDPDAAPMPLGRLWLAMTQPGPSTATVPTPNAATLTYVPDVGGLYQLDFHVTDGDSGGPGGVDGPFRIDLDVLEAIIGPTTVPLTPGTAVMLDGAAGIVPTTGATGAPTSGWSVLTVPAGSGVPTGAAGAGTTVTFTPDIVGDFEIELSVAQDVQPADGSAAVTLTDSARVTLVVETLEAVIAAPSGPFAAATPIDLDASSSVVFVIADVDAPAFEWEVTPPPTSALMPSVVGSNSMLSFTPDITGDYEIALTVSQTVTPADGGTPVTFTDTVQETLTVN